jgi:ABC-type transport system substrate-binding protein
MMEYRKNPDYWGGDPFIDRWSAPIIPEYANQYAQFIRGNITAFTPSAREVLQLARDLPQAVIVANPIPDDHISRIRFGRQNHKTLPWKDARVRVAIKRSIDMRSISEFLANKQQFEAGGIPVEIKPRSHLTGNVAWWLNPEKNELGPVSANLLFDAAEAKKLIEAAGFTTPIDIDWYTLPVGGQAPESDQLTIDRLQASRNFNVNVIRSQNTVAHRECRSLGRCDGLVQSSTSEDADHVIYRDFHSAGNTEGEQAYPDPRIDRIAELQRREMNPDKRVEYLMSSSASRPSLCRQYLTFTSTRSSASAGRGCTTRTSAALTSVRRPASPRAGRSRAATCSGWTPTCLTGSAARADLGIGLWTLGGIGLQRDRAPAPCC